MLDPKIFYRKLDLLLDTIGKKEATADFFISILNSLEHTFGTDLHLNHSHIFAESEDEYMLIYPEQSEYLKQTIPMESRFIKNILEFQTYIFDNPDSYENEYYRSLVGYGIPVGITVRSPDFGWIFIFSLSSGWIREEVEFCLNAVRNALNYRLSSEHHLNEKLRARGIQQSLLPDSAPYFEGFRIAGRSLAADIVGGDLYDFYPFDDDQLGVCIGDASGHGIPAALLARDVVTGLRMGLNRNDLVSTFQKLNRIIFRSDYSSHFISLFYANIQKDGRIEYVNAGHPAPLLYDGSDFHSLNSTGLLFGALREIEISKQYTRMESGSLLFMYTDGIFERQNKKGNLFGINRIKTLLKENFTKEPDAIINILFNAIYEFGEPAAWQDDATVVVIKRG